MKCMMFGNPNTGIEKELAMEDYKVHTVRNRVAVLAVILTAVLLAVVFNVGLSLVRTVSLATGASPGPGADGNCVYGDYEILEKVRALPQVEWAAFVRRCSSTYLHNKEFAGVETRLFAADSVHYDKNKVELIVGKYPERPDEILVPDTMSEQLELGEKVGIVYPIVIVVRENGEDVEKEIPMTICGYYRNPLENIKNMYAEVYTHESFIHTYNPGLSPDGDIIYVKLNNLEFFRFGHDKEEKMDEVIELSGAKSRGYKMSDLSIVVIIPVFLMALMIMSCGYFFIYNVFDISITNEIRFYGKVKTIGMTSKQLRRMLFIQMNRIAMTGIAVGSIIGFLIGDISGKIIIHYFMDGISGYYQPAGFVKTFTLNLVFSWLTVYISTMKPFKIACRISPVEAARYGGKRKKGIFSVISFSLSGILFLAVYTLAMGYDIEIMKDRYNETDFRVTHRGSIWAMDEAYMPVSREMVERLEELPFVENFRVYYEARVKPDYKEEDGEINVYLASMGEIVKEGEIARDLAAYNEKLEEGSYNRITESEKGNYRVGVMGMEAEYLPAEEKYFHIIEGKMDAEKFEEGGYMVYQRCPEWVNVTFDKEEEGLVHAGDHVKITFWDDRADQYMKKEFIVMAVIACTDPYGTSNIQHGNIVLNDEDFKSIYSGYEDFVTKICFDDSAKAVETGVVALREEKERYEAVREVIRDEGNLQMYFQSKYEDEINYTGKKRIMMILGIFLAGIVGLIGISNVVNTVSTDVSARKLEYAAMQSIGMTKKQMERDIFGKYARYVFLASGLAAVGGAALTYFLGMNSLFTGFSVGEFLQALIMLLVFSVLLCGCMARILTSAMNKQSVVERLRSIT
jgi:putative ABC transport system permease protein